MRRVLLFLMASLLLSVPVLCDENVPEPTQNPDATYRLFRTQNIYTLLKLDTRSGQVWQVQWGDEDYRWVAPINVKPLAAAGKPGRFSLYPTKNIYTFILLDQEDGRCWRIQWGIQKEDRLIQPIEL